MTACRVFCRRCNWNGVVSGAVMFCSVIDAVVSCGRIRCCPELVRVTLTLRLGCCFCKCTSARVSAVMSLLSTILYVGHFGAYLSCVACGSVRGRLFGVLVCVVALSVLLVSLRSRSLARIALVDLFLVFRCTVSHS